MNSEKLIITYNLSISNHRECVFPRISISVPTLNQAKFNRETVQGVVEQKHPNLALIVLDGGSTDVTLEILQKYTGSLVQVSELDNGQVDAINKGQKLTTGEVVAYLNSDDVYSPNTLLKVGQCFMITRKLKL